jgi:type II secretory pathway component PulJ
MIAITILAGLSLLTAQAIRSGTVSREKMNRQIRADAELRDVLRVMERDINVAFHHRDIFTTMLNEIEREKAQAASQAQPTGQPGQQGQTPPPELNPLSAEGGVTEKKPPKQLTAFIGDKESLHFTALANIRLQRDIQEGDQAEVGYFLKACKSRAPREARRASATSQCLVRRLSPVIDEDVTTGGNEVVILENVQVFQLRYFGPEREDWVETWKTGENGDAISKENFPYAVEVSLEVHDKADPKAKKVSATMVAPLRFPNNPPKKKTEEGQPNGQTG